MALEDLTGTSKFISALNPAWPVDDDWVDEGDNHIRGIKNVLKNTFPNLDAAVSLTDEQLNALAYAPRRFILRASGAASPSVLLKWGATIANDAKLIAMEAEIEQVVPVTTGNVEFGFYPNNPVIDFPAGAYGYVSMINESGNFTPVGGGTGGGNTINLGGVEAAAHMGLTGRFWWPMSTGTALPRGTYEVYKWTGTSEVNMRGVFHIGGQQGVRVGGMYIIGAGGGVSIGKVTVWGHYIP